MASHSPQRPRRPQAQQANQGPIHIHQQRETSRSPTLLDRERPRAAKTQSMPMVPSITAFAPQPPQPTQNTQPSPSLPNNGGRRSPMGQAQRLLPTPPHNNGSTFDEERRLSPPPGQQQTMNPANGNQHYPRPGPRAAATSFPNRHQNLEEDWQMTPELLAEIEFAHQQAQYQATQPLSYPPPANGESSPALKGPSLDRVRATDRLSPINLDIQQRGRREQQQRDSPKTGGRHPASPKASSFEATLTPESRLSPPPIAPESHPANSAAHYNTRESPPVLRRAPAAEQRVNQAIVNQTPPLQAVAARNPDRSLPVQEEDENGGSSRASWQDTDTLVESQFSSSPTPSSDLNPDGKVQAVHHEDDKKKCITHDEDRSQYASRDSTEEENGYTPRSPTVVLPEDSNDSYYPGSNVPIRVPVPVPLRPKGRNGTGDHIMRGLENTLMDSKQAHPAPPASVPQQQQQQQPQPPKYSEQRQPLQPQPQLNPTQYPKPYPSQEYPYAQQPIRGQNGQYLPPQPQVYPDDFQYTEDTTSYIQSYLNSPRPDAPVPPTPHTATAAPSPSPYMPSQRPVGSPYPFPFNHVRRNRQNQNSRLIANGLDPATITEQIARQWQIYAQNNHGNMTDSTLSPSTTPFQGDLFNQWAYLHTNRMMKGFHEAASMHSSPSHQPVPLPIPPHFGAKKKEKSLNGRKQSQSFSRKPPPRVQSTQPRDTSPELSSSGEETAGDDRATATPDIALPVTNGQQNLPILITEIPIEILDDDGEWVDEDDEDDYDDLIDLEYHPSFIKNVSKRRRKWEVGWENLIQAFQALDRQTDATMILLASPSHSTKLHALRSRSIRRQPVLSNSANMDDVRASFSRIATQRRKTRPDKSSLVDRLAIASTASGGDGSDGSSQSVEENLRRALDAALGSLGALGQVYEEREARVVEELRRSREDRERVELLLRQVLGDKNPLSNTVPLFSP